jgi:hypothetical protein
VSHIGHCFLYGAGIQIFQQRLLSLAFQNNKTFQKLHKTISSLFIAGKDRANIVEMCHGDRTVFGHRSRTADEGD